MTTIAPFPPTDGTQPCMQDPEMFFPKNESPEVATPAVALCRRCPFVNECLAYALTHDVQGVWGGTSEKQRRRLRRIHGITRVATIRSESFASLAARISDLRRAGLNNVDIAARLQVSEYRVKRHVRDMKANESLRSPA